MTIQSPLALGLAALALTACAMAMGGQGPSSAGPTQGAAPDAGGAPFRCALVARAGGPGTVIQGRLDAASAVSGTYALSIRSSGAVIDQDGDFAAQAGESLVLGEAQLGGQRGAIEATLTLTAGGRTTTCPLERS